MEELYTSRKLAQGYPDLEKLSSEKLTATLEEYENTHSLNEHKGDHCVSSPTLVRLSALLRWLDRLMSLDELKNVLILGCGPRPVFVKALVERGYDAVGVEPAEAFVRSGEEYVGSPDRVLEGSAEDIPLPDGSQDLVICESVLEHVDSPTKSIDEIYRVLRPGGIAIIGTTNRYRFSPKGYNGEYNVRYFNWLPDTVKESYVFHHLHYDPSLANYTSRPAVHWFSYADLCKLGRQAGFYQFYSILDLIEFDDPLIKSKVPKSLQSKLMLNKLKFNPWLHALALTQVGGYVYMLKR